MTPQFIDSAGLRPASDLVLVGPLAFAHGLIGQDLLNPKRALAESVEAQTRQIMGNLDALLAPQQTDVAPPEATGTPSAEPPSEVDFARRQWLAQAIDISPTKRHVQLTFRNSERAAQIAMDPATLQKWLDCLHEAYRTAAWTAPAPKTRAEQDAPTAPIRALKITH